jgi:hypothetical protein
MKKAFGGYFGLELGVQNNFFSESNFVELNSGRNCLEYILKVRKYDLLYIPYYTCDVILEPLVKLNIPYSFYDIDDNLEPIFDFEIITENQGFLYTNYFGVKDKYIAKVANTIPNLIIDNAQSLFSLPLQNIDTFYSPRKFVGVADSGFVSIKKKLNELFAIDISWDRMSHLLKRIDLSAEDGYLDFCKNDLSLENQPIKTISNLTNKILQGIDYESVIKRRKENFLFLNEALSDNNKLSISIDEFAVPMVYPFRTKDAELKKKLLNERIYCATYWPNVFEWTDSDKNSYHLTKDIIALPIDQRYTATQLEIIIKIIKG